LILIVLHSVRYFTNFLQQDLIVRAFKPF